MLTQKFMKRLILIIGLITSIAAASTVFGQTAQGVITYETKVNVHRTLPPGRESMKAMIPEFRTFKNQLFYKTDESIYKPLIEDEEEPLTGAGGSGGGVRMTIAIPNNEIYLNQTSGRIISKQEFMGKEYLIEDSVKLSPWKFGTEVKTIQGFECKQAYYTDESRPERKQEITAWYTDKIRPFLGPERFNTLPGAVLAVDINNGERVILANKIEMRDLKKNELKAPTSGVKTTQKEFRKMMDEQMERMRANGGMVIRN
jgi:GLPGLI family protein